jgi:hypothetical protein
VLATVNFNIMGVMSCSRKDCDNIMCDTYVQSVGYICSDCKSEFKEYLQKNGLNPTTEGQINKELEKFMATSKDTYKDGNETTVDDFFNERTR